MLPLAEYRVPFTVERSEIDDIQRGTRDPELDDLARAAQVAAELENRAVLNGWTAAGIAGIGESSPYPVTDLGDDCSTYPGVVAVAVDRLRQQGHRGALRLRDQPRALHRDRRDGRARRLSADGPHHADPGLRVGRHRPLPGLDGALVVSQRGGDFLLDVGQDISIGYSHHDADVVHLYLEESFTFLVAEPDAAVVLR